jgi:carboxylate-amine ligase
MSGRPGGQGAAVKFRAFAPTVLELLGQARRTREGLAVTVTLPRAVAARPEPVDGDESAVPTVGVEEEFFLLHPDGRTAGIAPDLLGVLGPDVRASAEFSRCQIETTTGVCSRLTAVGRELSVTRRLLAEAAADLGARLVAAGTPPVDLPGAAELTDDDRYRRLLLTMPGVTAEEIACAGQVHVAVSSRDLGAAVLSRLRPWLPVLLAMTGNSPLWRARDTGWSSYRFVVLQRWPSFGPPPRCADAAAYDARVDQLVGSNAALDEQGIYFWARLSPRYPTVEIRIADACLTVPDAVLLTGLCRAAVMTAIAEEMAGQPVHAASDRVLVAAAYSAARRGLSAIVVHPWRGGWVSAAALQPELMARLTPALEASGDRRIVETLLTARLRRGSGADRQRSLWHRGSRADFVQAMANLGAGLHTWGGVIPREPSPRDAHVARLAPNP